MAKGEDITVDETLLDESGEPRVYELGFHLDPELPSEEVKKTYQEIRNQITDKGAIVAEGEPENIQLAYTISRQDSGDAHRRDFSSAYFSWIVYEASPESHTAVVSAAALNTRIIRFIDLVTTKDAARHAVEMRELAKKLPEKPQEPEEIAATELDAALENAVI